MKQQTAELYSKIQKDYREMREKKMSMGDALEVLKNKYYLSESGLTWIIYNKKRKKKEDENKQ